MREAYDKIKEEKEGTDDASGAAVKDALLRRALQCVEYAMKLNAESPHVQQAEKDGAMPIGAFDNFKKATAEVNEEIEDIKIEADLVEPGLSEKILQQASSIIQAQVQQQKQMQQKQQQMQQQMGLTKTIKIEDLTKERYTPKFEGRDRYEAMKKDKEDKDDAKGPEVQKALMERAVQCIGYTVQFNSEGSQLEGLVKAGKLDEAVFEHFKQQSLVVNAEIKDIQNEADWIKPGWSQQILQQAGQLHKQAIVRNAQLEAAAKMPRIPVDKFTIERYSLKWLAQEKYAEFKATKGDDLSGQDMQKALLNRAVECMEFAMRLNLEGPQVEVATKDGKLAEGVADKFKESVDVVNKNIREIQDEANLIQPGWGNQILNQAQQLYQQIQMARMQKAQQQAQMQKAQEQAELAAPPKEEAAKKAD